MTLWNKKDLDQFETYFDRFSDINIDSIVFGSDINKECDGYQYLNKGDLYEFLIDPFKFIQPKTYKYLIEGNFFYFIKKKPLSRDDGRYNRIWYISQ